MVLPSSTTLIFFQIFMNFGWAMVGQSSGNFCYQKFFLSIKIFKVRFLSIIQEFFTEIFSGAAVFFLLVFFMMVLWSSFDIRGASLARMHFFFVGTWRLNILKRVLLHIPKLSTLEAAVTVSYLNLTLSKFL